MAKPTTPSVSDAREIKRRMHSTRNADRKPHADFPTPLRAAKWMVQFADLHTGTSILEPSAGEGRIVTAIADWYWNYDFDAPIHVDAIEIDSINWPLLEARCSDVPDGMTANAIRGDFMNWKPAKGKLYDYVLMNPPFNKGAWLKHVTKALTHLKDDGVLVAIIPGGRADEKLAKLLADSEWSLSLLHRGLFEESGAKQIQTMLLEVKAKVCDFIRAVNASAIPNMESARRIRELITKIVDADYAQANGGWADQAHTIPSNGDDVEYVIERRMVAGEMKTYRVPRIYEWDDEADADRVHEWEKEANELAQAMGFKCIDFSSNFHYNAITADDRRVFIEPVPNKVNTYGPDSSDEPRRKTNNEDRGLNLLTLKQQWSGSWIDEDGYDDAIVDDGDEPGVFENTTPDYASWAGEQQSMF